MPCAGPALISLVQSPTSTPEWDIPAGTVLTSDQMTALLQGKLYVIADSTAVPTGFIRGQFLPPNVTLIYANLLGSQEVPPVTTTAFGVAATTVDTVANTVTVHVQSMGVDDATAAQVDTGAPGATGPKLVALTKDSVNMGHWSIELTPITAADVANFNASKWYVNVATPADPSGAIRGQIDVPSH